MDKILSNVITLDGPAASGKTTVGSLVAKRLNLAIFDSGSLYRAFCWYLIKNSVKISPREVYLALQEFNPMISFSGIITVDGENVTSFLHNTEVNSLVPLIASSFFVRKHVRKIQRQFCIDNEGKVIVTGRDVGKDVFPESKCKIFLKATAEARAKRRFEQMAEKLPEATYESILAGIKSRDLKDGSRKVSPMGMAEDAYVIDSSEFTLDEAVSTVLRVISKMRANIEGARKQTTEIY